MVPNSPDDGRNRPHNAQDGFFCKVGRHGDAEQIRTDGFGHGQIFSLRSGEMCLFVAALTIPQTVFDVVLIEGAHQGVPFGVVGGAIERVPAVDVRPRQKALGKLRADEACPIKRSDSVDGPQLCLPFIQSGQPTAAEYSFILPLMLGMRLSRAPSNPKLIVVRMSSRLVQAMPPPSPMPKLLVAWKLNTDGIGPM